MLSGINIQNFLLIPSLNIEFHPGLNLLTGETGAGKSIIIDALKLLLGAKTDVEAIREGAQSATIEGIFELPTGSTSILQQMLEDIGVKCCFEEGLTIRREIRASGRHRIFVNDASVTAATLKKIQPFVLDIHGQFEQQSLLSATDQLDFVDTFADLLASREETIAAFRTLQRLMEEKQQLAQAFSEREQKLDLFRFQIEEIGKIKPLDGEDVALQCERELLVSVEKRAQLSSETYDQLYENDASVLATLAGVLRRVNDLRSLDARIAPVGEAIEQAVVLLKDAAETILDYGQQAEYSPARLAEIEERLAQLERLKRKYNASLAEIAKLRQDLDQKILELQDFSYREQSLERELTQALAAYRAAAARLSAARQEAVPELERRVKQELEKVALENASFVVRLEAVSFGDDVLAQAKLSPSWAKGLEQVEFMLSANPGESLKPLARVASGGELSRLMLTLRLVVAHAGGKKAQSEETLIFDEIDAGVGGRAAEAVGRRLKLLADRQQVICVTHQPQIARFADHHFHVSKAVTEGRSVTSVRELSDDERIGELARMIGGAEDAVSTREAARWLLESGRARDGEAKAVNVAAAKSKAKKNKRNSRVPAERASASARKS